MNIYVGENQKFKTVYEAVESLKTISGETEVKIIFDDSEVFLAKPIKVTEKYPFKLTFTSEKGTLLSGGVHITGFEKVEGKPYYAAKTDLAPFRQLFANGVRRQRARTGLVKGKDFISGDFSDKDGILFAADVIPDVAKPHELEIVWDRCEWRHFRHSVEKIVMQEDGSTYNSKSGLKYVYMKQPYFARGLMMDNQFMRTFLPHFDNQMYFENALEFLTEPGMWYWSQDDNILYYYPMEDEDINKIDIIAAQTEFAVIVEGTRESRVRGVEFTNLDFKYFTWNFPTKCGLPCLQASWLNLRPCIMDWKTVEYVDGNIWLKYCDDIGFKNCVFENLGACALRVEVAASDIKIEDCKFNHISEGGIQVGRTSEIILEDKDRDLLVNKIVIARNIFKGIGEEYTAGVGILTYYPYDVLIENNEISDTSYSAISIGWGWGAKHNTFGKHVVRNNIIYDFMKVLRDGGGIYMLGEQNGTEIYGNYLCDQVNEFAAIYTDNGTRNVNIHDNVFKNVDITAFPYEPMIANIVFKNNWMDNCNVVNFGTDCVVDENYLYDARYFPKEAQDIINNAGCGMTFETTKTGAYNKVYSRFDLKNNPIEGADFSDSEHDVTAVILDADEIITPGLVSLSLHRHGNDHIYSLYLSEDMKKFTLADRKHMYGPCGVLQNSDGIKGRYVMITVEHVGRSHKMQIPINHIKIV